MCFLTISIFSLTGTFAQVRKGFNRIELHYVPRYYLDKLNVSNVNVVPNPIRPHNTFGHAFGLAYERVTRYGLVIDGGIQFGIRKHNIDIFYDVSDYDPDAKNTLKGKVYSDNLKYTLYDINPYFFIGYRRPLNKKWAVVVKVGGAEKRFLWQGYYYFNQPISVTYVTDDNSQTRTSDFLFRTATFGDDKRNTSRLFSNVLAFYTLFIGTDFSFSKGFIKNISAGIEYSALYSRHKSSYADLTVYTYPTYNSTTYNTDKYFDNYRSLGLKLAVGFWR